MANGWKTPKQIQEDYGISQGTFYYLKKKCESSDFKDAIIHSTDKNIFIVEQRWEDYMKSLMDPSIKTPISALALKLVTELMELQR